MNHSVPVTQAIESNRSEAIEFLLTTDDQQRQKEVLSILSRRTAGLLLEATAQDCRAEAALISGYMHGIKETPAKTAVYQQLFMLTEMLDAAATSKTQNEYNEARGYAQQILERLAKGTRTTQELITAVVSQADPDLIRRALWKLKGEQLIEGDLNDENAALLVTDDGIEAAAKRPSED